MPSRVVGVGLALSGVPQGECGTRGRQAVPLHLAQLDTAISGESPRYAGIFTRELPRTWNTSGAEARGALRGAGPLSETRSPPACSFRLLRAFARLKRNLPGRENTRNIPWGSLR